MRREGLRAGRRVLGRHRRAGRLLRERELPRRAPHLRGPGVAPARGVAWRAARASADRPGGRCLMPRRATGMRAAGYVRVSTDEQVRDGWNLDEDKARIRELGEREGWELVE